jgi:sulfur carrier protein
MGGIKMNIIVTGNKKDYPEGLTVTELLEREKVDTPQYVTVSVNDAFIRSEDFTSATLKEGDTIEFLYFMGGGR